MTTLIGVILGVVIGIISQNTERIFKHLERMDEKNAD